MILVFALPSLLIVVGLIESFKFITFSTIFTFALMNFTFAALPLLACYLVLRFLKSARNTIYGGLIGANVILLLLMVLSLWHSHDGFIWLVYYPLAVAFIFIGGLIGRSISGRNEDCA